jgi:NhaA family Na+:H+ antiporter
VLAAIGGMAGPASLYFLAIAVLDLPELRSGWAIPCATDIAFSYLVARVIFPANHPAIPFLLLLAIADDALGLIVLAIFYPSGDVSLVMLAAFMMPALSLAWTLRRFGIESFWVYLAGPGVLSWLALYYGGLHPALALVPILPLMPHHDVDIWPFGKAKPVRLATMHHFEQWWKVPVQIILFGFGFANAGVPFSAVGAVTWIVMGSLVIGKPFGIVATTLLAEALGFRRARGLDYRSLVTLGVAAGIGFTVALFFAAASFPPGLILSEAKMGALLSFFASFIAIGVGRALGIRRTATRRTASGR